MTGCPGAAEDRAAAIGAELGPCDKWAAPTGQNGAAGTQQEPYRRVAEMATRLGAGQTGCLQSGATFDDPIALGAWILGGVGGQPGSPITIRSSDPANPAQVKAAVWVQGSAHDIVISDVDFFDSYTGVKGNMIQIEGDRIELRNNDISYPRGICVGVGKLDQSRTLEDQTANPNPGFGPPQKADAFVLEGNRVHGCGAALADQLTGQDSGVHGVYLIYGSKARLTDNLIYDNVNRGLQLYPRVDQASIEHNVLDGNGSNLHISAADPSSSGHVSSDNLVRNNLITNAVLRASNPNANWPPGDSHQVFGCCFPSLTATYGNLITENCIYHPNPQLNLGGRGYQQTANSFIDPLYANRAGKDFQLREGSPCAGKGPRLDVAAPPPPLPPPVPPLPSSCDAAKRRLAASQKTLGKAVATVRRTGSRKARRAVRLAKKRVASANERVRTAC